MTFSLTNEHSNNCFYMDTKTNSNSFLIGKKRGMTKIHGKIKSHREGQLYNWLTANRRKWTYLIVSVLDPCHHDLCTARHPGVEEENSQLRNSAMKVFNCFVPRIAACITLNTFILTNRNIRIGFYETNLFCKTFTSTDCMH